jgi:hypothetical protein
VGILVAVAGQGLGEKMGRTLWQLLFTDNLCNHSGRVDMTSFCSSLSQLVRTCPETDWLAGWLAD